MIPNAHDWTLVSVSADWEAGVLRVLFDGDGDQNELRALGLKNLLLPRKYEWGPSVSVNRTGPIEHPEGLHLKIEMQSGDVIEILAGSFAVRPL